MPPPPDDNDSQSWQAWADEVEAEVDRLVVENNELRAKIAEQADTIRRLQG